MTHCVMGYENKNLIVINADKIKSNKLEKVFERLTSRVILPFLVKLSFNRNKTIRDKLPNPLPDRMELEDIVFDDLDLSNEERNKVYWSVAELVNQGLDKAASR